MSKKECPRVASRVLVAGSTAVFVAIGLLGAAAQGAERTEPLRITIDSSRVTATPLGQAGTKLTAESRLVNQGVRGDVAWVDGVAAGGGGIAGGHPNCPGEGSCFEPNQTPGCDDEDCCNLVCFTNPFCCDEGWDEFCEFDADILCESICKPDPPQAGAIFSNVTFDCIEGFFTHGELIAADDLFYGNSGGTLQEISFSVVNGTDSDLSDVSLEVTLSTTAPGIEDGSLDLSTAIVIFEFDLEGLDLEAGFGTLLTATDLEEFEIFLPAPMVYAGLRYMDATFTGAGSLDDLGQFIASPPGAGSSGDGFFFEGLGPTAFFGGDPLANFMWEVVTDETVGPNIIIYDTAPQQAVIFNGKPAPGLGWSSGNLSAEMPQRWSAMPFTLPSLPTAGVNEWNVTGLFVHGFSATPAPSELAWTIWSRSGSNAPVDGDQVAQGVVPTPQLWLGHGENEFPSSVHPIEVDLQLPPGDYYLTVFGQNPGGAGANWAWFTNAHNGISLLGTGGDPFKWRSESFPVPGFEFYTLPPEVLAPHPDQPDPNTIYNASFFIMGNAGEVKKDPCPEDLNNDGVVNVFDLLILLGAWGACPGCPEDLNNDGVVNVFDLLILLGAWGACP